MKKILMAALTILVAWCVRAGQSNGCVFVDGTTTAQATEWSTVFQAKLIEAVPCARITGVESAKNDDLCVSFSLCPAPNSWIRGKVRLPPAKRWDGRLWGFGNGGWAGNVSCYTWGDSATVHTDLGTARIPIGTNPVDPEILKDFGWRATHLANVVARQLIGTYYGRPPHHAYFFGASTGGGQALCEAQRYPSDYDGIIASVPALDRSTRATIVWQFDELKRTYKGKWFMPEEQRAIRRAELDYFAKTDPPIARGRFIWNPHPTPEKLAGCWQAIVTAQPQLADRRELWYALFDPVVVKGHRFAPTQLLGIEFACPWTFMFEKRVGSRDNGHKMTADELFAFAQDPDLIFTSPDLSAFRQRGGKIIMFSGLEDESVPARPITEYYERVCAREGGKMSDYFAYYEIPGRWHDGAGRKDGLLGAVGEPAAVRQKIVTWVEKSVPPGALSVPFSRGVKEALEVEPYVPAPSSRRPPLGM